MVYASGTSSSISEGGFVSASFDGNGGVTPTMGRVEQKTKSVSALAQRFAPPEINRAAKDEARLTMFIVLAGISFVLALLTLGSALFTISFAFGLAFSACIFVQKGNVSRARIDDEKSRRLLKEWNESFLCFTCGDVFKAGVPKVDLSF